MTWVRVVAESTRRLLLQRVGAESVGALGAGQYQENDYHYHRHKGDDCANDEEHAKKNGNHFPFTFVGKRQVPTTQSKYRNKDNRQRRRSQCWNHVKEHPPPRPVGVMQPSHSHRQRWQESEPANKSIPKNGMKFKTICETTENRVNHQYSDRGARPLKLT